jgi:hypothetical protein
MDEMDRIEFEKAFSKERMGRYFAQWNDDEKAFLHYQWNIRLSESFYPVLSIYEVALRNSLDRELTRMYGSPEWYNNLSNTPGLRDLSKEITRAMNHITKRGEQITPSKVVAELNLGFWTRLFNTEYELILWKDLRKAFPFMPKSDRKRANVSSSLNRIRSFRNRIYHNEGIAWNLKELEKQHRNLHQTLGWLNKRLPIYTNAIDRFPTLWPQVQIDLTKHITT